MDDRTDDCAFGADDVARLRARVQKTTISDDRQQIYPYLLRGVSIERPNQVWSTDITYIPMRGGFLYLVAAVDWFSRFVLSWELSNTMETGFCLAALEAACRFGQPEIRNSDQGSQFTSADFLAPLKKRGISISMDGRGRALDKAYASHCTSSARGATTSAASRRFDSLTPMAFRGGLFPGCSYRQSFLPL